MSLINWVQFFVVFVPNLWFFKKVNFWYYIIPSIILFGFSIYKSDLTTWVAAFLGGWILAWVVNFVVGLAKK